MDTPKKRIRKRNTEPNNNCLSCTKELNYAQKERKNKFCSHECFCEFKHKKVRRNDSKVVCNICKQVLDANMFGKGKIHRNGSTGYCTKCLSERCRQRKPNRKDIDFKKQESQELKEKGKKRCIRCENIFDLKDFYTSRYTLDGFLGHCIFCERKASHKNSVKIKFGLDHQDFDKLKDYQNNACSICKKSFEEIQLHVDHCHTKGHVRGLLCVICNTKILPVLEIYGDLLEKAKEYLENSPAVNLLGLVKPKKRIKSSLPDYTFYTENEVDAILAGELDEVPDYRLGVR